MRAHHVRLWNRKFTIKPVIADNFKKHFQNNDKLYAQAAILNVFLSVIAKGSRWTSRLFTLLKDNPHIPIQEMGFFENWQTDSFWRIHTYPTSVFSEIQDKILKSEFVAYSTHLAF